MKSKIYRHMTKNEFVFEEEAKDYVLDTLGIKIEPKGKNGEYTTEQLDFIDTTIEWFFSGEWYEDELIEDEEIEQYEPDFARTENDYLYDYWRQENTI